MARFKLSSRAHAKSRGARSPCSQRKGDRPTADEAAKRAAATIEKLGNFLVALGHTRDPHAETVVFAARGFESQAQKIAAALANAKVQPLTWKPDADIVTACVAR